jgi:hydrogenase expression/formation protein HypC
MCLGIPGRVLSVCDGDLRTGRVDFGGIVKEICLAYVPEANVGDYVIVHVGFAISRVDEAEAARVFRYLDEIDELAELALPQGDAGRS